MTRLAIVLVLLALAAGCATLDDEAASRNAERQILVTVQQAESSAVALLGAPGRRYLRRRDYGASPNVERVLSQLADELELRRVRGWPIPSLEVYCEVLEVPLGESVDDVLARLADDPRIELAQPMNRFHTLGTRYNDPYADLQPAIASLGLEQAHAFATGKGVLVAVIDSAVDSVHPELRGRIGTKRNLVGAGGRLKHGEVHGTAVAGVIASTANNTEGIIGVAPEATIAALRACWPVGPDRSAAECSSFSLAQALEAALNLEPQIINLSLSGPPDPLLALLLDEAVRRGIIVVAAAPDEPAAGPGFPASHAGVIAAQAELGAGRTGARLLLGAPAKEILTTTPGAGYGFLSGSSLAAAHVTGVIALLLEQRPGMDAYEIAALLDATATVVAGAHTINACRALVELRGGGDCDAQIGSNP